jgi:hypothetical protein
MYVKCRYDYASKEDIPTGEIMGRTGLRSYWRKSFRYSGVTSPSYPGTLIAPQILTRWPKQKKESA